MASPRDLFDAGAPAWRLPSAAGTPGYVATVSAAGPVAWAPATTGAPPVVALSAAYQMQAMNDLFAPIPTAAPTAALDSYTVTTITATGGGQLTETALTLPGFVAAIPPGADSTGFAGASIAVQPNPPIASSNYRKRVNIYVTPTGGAEAVYLGECLSVGGGVDDLYYVMGSLERPAPVDLSITGGSMTVGPVSFYTASVAP